MPVKLLPYVGCWERGQSFQGGSQSSGVIGADSVRALFYLLGPHFTITALNGVLLKLTPAAFFFFFILFARVRESA